MTLLAAAALIAVGIGPANAQGAGTPNLTPDPVDFGSVTVGQAEVRTVQVLNDSAADITIASVAVSSVTLLSTTCSAGLLLTPGQQCGIVVEWRPARAGALSGSVTVNSSSGTRVASATGTAVQPLRLRVRAHAKTLRIRQDATLIRDIRTNGKVTKAKVWCTYLGKRLPAGFAKRACGLRVTGSGARLRAQAHPLCSEDLALRAVVSASGKGDSVDWKRTWMVFVHPHAGGHPNVPICATMGERFGAAH